MDKSALQIERASYQPKLPKALQGAVKVKEGKPTKITTLKDFLEFKGRTDLLDKIVSRKTYKKDTK